jgi:hypothetical protein
MANQLNTIAEKFLKTNDKEFKQKNYKEAQKALESARKVLQSSSPVADSNTLADFERYHPISKPSGNFKNSWKISTKKTASGYSFKVYNKYPELTSWLANGHRLIQGGSVSYIKPDSKFRSGIQSAKSAINNIK